MDSREIEARFNRIEEKLDLIISVFQEILLPSEDEEEEELKEKKAKINKKEE